MKIGYLLSHDIFLNDGITKKIYSQANIWKSLGHQVKIFNILVKKNIQKGDVPPDTEIFFRENVISGPAGLDIALENYNPDIVYFRYEPYKPFLRRILVQYPAIFELNTDDIAEHRLYARRGIKESIRCIYNLITRNMILSRAQGFVSVSEEIGKLPHFSRFKKKIITIPNSIDLEEFPVLKRKKNNSRPVIIFLGKPGYVWHGIDKIIRLAASTRRDLEYHVVGYEKPSSVVPENIKFHGYLNMGAYRDIIKRCDIGLSTLALHRKNLNEASSLKCREYLAYGLPVITGYKDTAFLHGKKPAWILEIPNTENNVLDNVNAIIEFSYRHKDYIVTHQEISKYIDAKVLEEKKMKFFKEIISHAD